MPPAVAIGGGLATVGAILMVGKIASSVSQKTLDGLEAEKRRAARKGIGAKLGRKAKGA